MRENTDQKNCEYGNFPWNVFLWRFSNFDYEKASESIYTAKLADLKNQIDLLQKENARLRKIVLSKSGEKSPESPKGQTTLIYNALSSVLMENFQLKKKLRHETRTKNELPVT